MAKTIPEDGCIQGRDLRRSEGLERQIERINRKRRIFSYVMVALVVPALIISTMTWLVPIVSPRSETQGATPSNGGVSDQIAQLEQVIKEHPHDLEALVALGNHYYDLGRFAPAVRAYERALLLDPVNPNVQVDYGTSLLNERQPMQAIAAYQKVLKTYPRHVNARVNLGIAYHSIGEVAKATAEWHGALALAQDSSVRDAIKKLLKTAVKPD